LRGASMPADTTRSMTYARSMASIAPGERDMAR